MYQPGELVIYGSEGVCRVDKIGTLALSGIKSDKLYYTLSPLYREGTIFAPVGGKILMRPVLSRKEAETLVCHIPEIVGTPYENRNIRMLTDHYQKLIETYDCVNLVQLIKAIHAKQTAERAIGRKLGQVDERYMKRAEDILFGELAVALSIEKANVHDYITRSVTTIEGKAALSPA